MGTVDGIGMVPRQRHFMGPVTAIPIEGKSDADISLCAKFYRPFHHNEGGL